MATQKVICDTDVLIEFFDENKARYSQTVASIAEIGLNNILISAITKMELIKLKALSIRSIVNRLQKI